MGDKRVGGLRVVPNNRQPAKLTVSASYFCEVYIFFKDKLFVPLLAQTYL